ncbi:glycosylphosphatidylinositol-alpha 1,2 mannosyltransferase SCDLUD_003266 [Saccharomycodes ludwigii]|uniref:glycosylphosphatidylinositol-alpha 1,2 mannosyltransferase n=1 Tax=Saccharomycodes ludwigii TaxID=36035 RepID=UPI001E8295B1|nr:hypothetical protein SCDLUD_003266 [Saccharomycodes ludwigii]KAH3900294.1 hypothetical protein SCDLUD_003266 [Saccharomycodes ludwigii]
MQTTRHKMQKSKMANLKCVLNVILKILFCAFFVIQPSYIHPDEHFQCMEILMWIWNKNGFAVDLPWEFVEGARSFVPIVVWYLPLYSLFNNYDNTVSPTLLIKITRLYNFFIYFAILFFYIKARVFPNSAKRKRNKVLFLIITSYVTIAYQSHSFSNGIETNLLLLSLWCIDKCADKAPILSGSNCTNIGNKNILPWLCLGVLISIGVFNRITFIGFVILPLLVKLARAHNFNQILISLFTFAITSYLIILFDTKMYYKEWRQPHSTTSPIIAPLNNFLYNIDIKNLQKHGVHMRLTHLFVNIPQLLGPLILVLFSVKFLGIITIFDQYVHSNNNLSNIPQTNFIHIWWKTYSPPTWMYLNSNLEIYDTDPETERIEQNLIFDDHHSAILNLKGTDITYVYELFAEIHNKTNQNFTIILPYSVNSVLLANNKNNTYTFEKKWNDIYSLDMDHFNFQDISSFKPGMVAYNVFIL